MWTEVSRQITPMGNIYTTQKQGCFYKGVLTNKFTGEQRIQCAPTISHLVLKSYSETLFLVERDCLNGRNPYVTKEWSVSFRDSSSIKENKQTRLV